MARRADSQTSGMDPWLESCWGDVHTSLTTYSRDQIQPRLPGDLHAQIEEYVSVDTVEDHSPKSQRFEPDVRVLERPPDSAASTAVATAPAIKQVAEPLIVPLEIEPKTLRYIQIVEPVSGNRLVTSIEFLSHANKSNRKGRQQYRKQQEQMLGAGVNLVEIDLLRKGDWVLAVPETNVPPSHSQPYRISVVRGAQPDQAEVYAVELDDHLPSIRIPLRESDADVFLDLQQVIELAYLNGGYGRHLNYAIDPVPELPADQAEWADQLLRAKSVR